MVNFIFLSVFARTLLSITDVGALECFSCSKISEATACNTTVTCTTGHACYQESIVSGQTNTVTLGCVNNKQCGVAASGPGTLIGRGVTKRQENKCQECCGTDRCNNILCARRKHGGWTRWGNWGTCSVTCGGGFRSRTRTCTDPIPSLIRRYCEGDSSEVGSCNIDACRVTNVAFRCDGTGRYVHYFSNMTFKFGTISLNQGNGYNKSTGIFTAPEAGTYLFSTQLCVNQGHDLVYAIVVDDKNVKVGHFNDKEWTFCHSAVTVAVLSRGSRAWVKCVVCDGDSLVQRQSDYYSNTFSGVLVHV